MRSNVVHNIVMETERLICEILFPDFSALFLRE